MFFAPNKPSLYHFFTLFWRRNKPFYGFFLGLGTGKASDACTPPPPYRNAVKPVSVFYVDLRLRYVLLLILLVPIPSASCQSVYEMTWRYENKGSEVYDLTIKDLGVPVFMNTSSQTVRMTVNYTDWRIIELNEGFLKRIPVTPVSIGPGEKYTVKVEYFLYSDSVTPPKLDGESASGHIPEGMEDYLESSELYNWNISDITRLAGNLTRNEETVLGKTLSIIEWFGEYTTYTVNELPKRPWATVRDPRGDCDDFGLLFVSMCRSQGIPAFLQGGVVLSETLQLDETDWNGHYRYVFDGVGWHAWAMVYIPPWGWLPVDLILTEGMRPVDAIKEAYYWRESTFTMWNITSHDYVIDEVSQRNALIEKNIYWTQRDTKIDLAYEQEDPGYLFLGAAIGIPVAFFILLRRISAEG